KAIELYQSEQYEKAKAQFEWCRDYCNTKSSDTYKGWLEKCNMRINEQKQAEARALQEAEEADAVAAAERQNRFDGVLSDFEDFMDQPINVGNATRTIDNGYKIICQLSDTLTLYPELSKSLREEYIRRYNSKVDEAIAFIENAQKSPALDAQFYKDERNIFDSIKEVLNQKYYKK
ncbi:MAG: hypothetical protein K6A73_09330, partial [Bacteroidales bacterium]|nr:hypothetical protein [Bacteroidales bacterium]